MSRLPRLRTLLLTLGALLFTACATPTPVVKLRGVDTSLELVPDTVPFVRLSLNGTPEAPFLLDTGAETSLADRGWSARRGLESTGYFFPRTLQGIGWRRHVTARLAETHVELGADGTADRVTFQLLDLAGLRVPGEDTTRPVGLLGVEVFRHVALLFDAPNGVVRVIRPDVLNERLNELYPNTAWTAVPIERTEDLAVVHLTTDNGATARMLLDTGAEVTVVDRAFAEAALSLPDYRGDEQLAATLRGDASGERSRRHPHRLLFGVHLGPRELHFPAVQVDTKRGILGYDVLRTFPWVLVGDRLYVPIDPDADE